ncbi:hypothetical protein [Paraburkholderia sp. 40]|uniref:hypothetical protein n=1 Tax=Paraburkholderia sp. 40 TaxID=2991059 RepID=UPI003D2032CE
MPRDWCACTLALSTLANGQAGRTTGVYRREKARAEHMARDLPPTLNRRANMEPLKSCLTPEEKKKQETKDAAIGMLVAAFCAFVFWSIGDLGPGALIGNAREILLFVQMALVAASIIAFVYFLRTLRRLRSDWFRYLVGISLPFIVGALARHHFLS